MKPLSQHNLIVKKSLIHGRGVFANKVFEPHEVIEECYAIICEGTDNALKNYAFDTAEVCLIPTGFGLLYNHADKPNAHYYFDEARNVLIFKSSCRISPGEEILIHYGRTWFSSRKLIVKKMPRWHKLVRFLASTPLRTFLIIAALLLANQWLHVLTVR